MQGLPYFSSDLWGLDARILATAWMRHLSPTIEGFVVNRRKEVVISKGDARFWLDKNGFWHYGNEKFRHRKIINYFHSSIRKDEDGYHVRQVHRDYVERVYFPYEDTALFVFDVITDKDVVLILNTQKQIKLKPRRLFIMDDNLYMHLGEERVKFTEQALIRISILMEYENEQCYIRVKGRRYEIQQL